MSAPRSLRQALRSLARSPLFTVITVLTLSVAIGASSAIFSIVNGVLLRPLPYPESERLVVVGHTAPAAGFPEVPQANASYVLYRERSATLEELGLYDGGDFGLTGNGEPEKVGGAAVTESLFPVLRVVPALGRNFTAEEILPDAENVAILGHGLWQRRFGGDPGALGRTIEVDGVTRTVVGVMPAGFDLPYGEDAEIFVPFQIDREKLTTGSYSYTGIGRLKPGVTVEAAFADIDRLAKQLPDVYEGDFLTHEMIDEIGFAALIVPLIDHVSGDASRTLWILLGTVGLVLLVACANVANLFLVRAEGRHKEIAIRSALGAERGVLVRHFLRESTLLGLAGGALGLGLAFGAVRLLLALSPEGIPRLESIRVDGWVLAFTIGISLLAGLLSGLAPVLRHSRPDIAGALKEGFRGTTLGRARVRGRTALVLAQVALAFVLLVGSGLMAKSFWHLRRVDPGFDPEGVLTMRLALPNAYFGDGETVADFYQRLLDRVASLPGVESAGATTKLPLRSPGANHNGVLIEDRPVDQGRLPHVELSVRVTPGYFETMGIRLVEGRTVELADIEDRTGAVVVNQAFAQKYWSGENPIGKRIWPGIVEEMEDEDFGWWQIVGVVGDVRSLSLEEETKPIVYYAIIGPGDDYWSHMNLVVRTASTPAAFAPSVRAAVWEVDPRVPITDVETMSRVVADATSRAGFTMLMLVIAAGVALLLGSVGIYGVISYGVTQRRQEIGVRMALGAESQGVAGMVVRQGAVVAAIGLAVGVAAALGVTRVMEALLFEVSPTDPPTFGFVVALLFTVAVVASWVPARRAASVDPAIALRAE